MKKTIRIIDIPVFNEENGSLSVFEFKENILWPIKRVFSVLASKGDIRGEHAHLKCEQVLFCLRGEIMVRYSDGQNEEGQTLLKPNGSGILFPALIWSSQEYLTDECILMVLCSEKFDENDYLRNYDNFLRVSNEK
jgi:dTDP-4-dehydrorhamnose 3,5-epimerase-like enzyme